MLSLTPSTRCPSVAPRSTFSMKQLITDRTLRNLKPAPRGKRLVVWDTALPSFGVRMTDKGKASFFVMRRRGRRYTAHPRGSRLLSPPLDSQKPESGRGRLLAELAAGRVSPLRELRDSLSQMRAAGLSVGSDGRNRALLSAFGSRTGRNQPSSTKFIFGPSVWLRGLIKPDRGMALAYIDWSSQEFGIAAALSADKRMLEPTLRRSLPRLCQAGWCCPCGRDQAVAQARAGCFQDRVARRGLRHGGRCACQPSRYPAGRSTRAPAQAPGNVPRFWRWSQTSWIRRWRGTLFRWCSAGAYTRDLAPTRDPCGTSPCRRTAPKCYG